MKKIYFSFKFEVYITNNRVKAYCWGKHRGLNRGETLKERHVKSTIRLYVTPTAGGVRQLRWPMAVCIGNVKLRPRTRGACTRHYNARNKLFRNSHGVAQRLIHVDYQSLQYSVTFVNVLLARVHVRSVNSQLLIKLQCRNNKIKE